ncbi:hypothetical protein [uncultured Kiloniella sp.]|uniref:hypothetical protein n=1 Tax=uncultured Kiloniella sp. TaxID=1133091 RepID=UPI0026339768|nr:hypothetical protein [uncultured Kiloniella sp.]
MSVVTDDYMDDGSITLGKALSNAFSPLFSNLKTALKFTILPTLSWSVLILIGVFYALSMLGEETPTNFANFHTGIFVAIVGFVLLSVLISIQFYTAWIQFLRYGDTSLKNTFIFNIKKCHFVILGKAILLNILLFLISIIVNIPLGFISFNVSAILATIVPIILLLVLSIVSLRLSYVFPAAAIDQRFGFFDSWNATQKHWLRIFIAFVILAIIMIAASIAIQLVLGIIFSIFGAVFSSIAINANQFASASDISATLLSPGFLLMAIPAYFITMGITLVSYIPFINMHYYCFKTDVSVTNDQEMLDRFS